MADVLRVTVRGAGTHAKSLRGAALELDSVIQSEMRTMGARCKQALQAAVPRGYSDNLHDSVEVSPRRNVRRPGFEIVAGAEDEAGFDYLKVSRYGHRKSRIRPVRGQALSIAETFPGLDAATRGPHKGRTALRSVRGQRPAVDWVAVGLANSDHELDQMAERVGRRVERRLLR